MVAVTASAQAVVADTAPALAATVHVLGVSNRRRLIWAATASVVVVLTGALYLGLRPTESARRVRNARSPAVFCTGRSGPGRRYRKRHLRKARRSADVVSSVVFESERRGHVRERSRQFGMAPGCHPRARRRDHHGRTAGRRTRAAS